MLFERIELPESAEKYYNMSKFAMQLNEVSDSSAVAFRKCILFRDLLFCLCGGAPHVPTAIVLGLTGTIQTTACEAKTVPSHVGFLWSQRESVQILPNEAEFLAPTDSRLRPDQRALEENRMEDGDRDKLRLEEKQRVRFTIQLHIVPTNCMQHAASNMQDVWLEKTGHRRLGPIRSAHRSVCHGLRCALPQNPRQPQQRSPFATRRSVCVSVRCADEHTFARRRRGKRRKKTKQCRNRSGLRRPKARESRLCGHTPAATGKRARLRTGKAAPKSSHESAIACSVFGTVAALSCLRRSSPQPAQVPLPHVACRIFRTAQWRIPACAAEVSDLGRA